MTDVAGHEHVLVRDGLRLRLVDTAAGGTPVLFQHGLCGSEDQVAEVLPYGHPRRRLTLECRGHGRSDAGDPSGFSIPGFAEDVVAAAAARGVTSAVVGGISMGAAIALRLAVTRPDLVCGLVLARPAWITDPAPDCLMPNAVVGDLLSRHQPATALAMFEATPLRERLAREAPDNLASLRGFFSRGTSGRDGSAPVTHLRRRDGGHPCAGRRAARADAGHRTRARCHPSPRRRPNAGRHDPRRSPCRDHAEGAGQGALHRRFPERARRLPRHDPLNGDTPD